MEARLIVNGIGPWRNFDELEECLILDELLLLNEVYAEERHNHFRMLGSLQGIDIGEWRGGSEVGEDDLPPEVIERERQWQKHKEEVLKSGEPTFDGIGLGYQRI